MVGLAEEHDSAISLVIQEYLALQRLDPKNELLKVVHNVNQKGFDHTDEFSSRYIQESDKYSLQSISRYYLDLEDAVTKELSKILMVEKDKINNELENKFEEQNLMGLFRTHITHNQRPLII